MMKAEEKLLAMMIGTNGGKRGGVFFFTKDYIIIAGMSGVSMVLLRMEFE